jgi:hypothetical protein
MRPGMWRWRVFLEAIATLAALLVEPRSAIVADRAREPCHLDAMLGKHCLCVGDQRRSHARAMRVTRKADAAHYS